QDGPRAAAHLAAGRAQRGALPGLRAALRRAAQLRVPRRAARVAGRRGRGARPVRRALAARLRPRLDRARRRADPRAARLQAHARLLERRAHGHPRRRRGARRHRPVRRDAARRQPLARQGTAVPHRGQPAGGVRHQEQPRGARRAAHTARIRHALGGRLSRHRRHAAVRPVPQRADDPEVRAGRQPVRRRRRVPRPARAGLRGHGRRRAAHGAGRARRRGAGGAPRTLGGRAAARTARVRRARARAVRPTRARPPARERGGAAGRHAVSTVATLRARNAQRVDRDAVPRLEPDALAAHARARVPRDARVVAFFGWPAPGAKPEAPAAELLLVTARDRESRLDLAMTTVGAAYPALAPDVVSAARFEREIMEQLGVLPAGHPWLKPLRSHAPYGPGPHRLHDPALGIGADYPFFRVEGDEVHEVAVGPVHAGIIEPGHFRFQCYGERVLHLEIMLGFQHRGFERSVIGGPHPRTVHQVEELAGDTTIGHTLAYVQALEALGGCEVPARAHALRALALELERLAAHAGDLGALAGDVAFMPTAAYCGRLRGEFLNMTALLCGNRFGRGFVRPGGVAYDVDARMAEELRRRLDAALRDLEGPLDLFFETPSVTERLEGTGPVTHADCEALGLVGPVARACGAPRDVRRDH